MPGILKLEHFEGPLDLLLSLIEDQKLDISELALSQVTDQYIKYLENFSENEIEAADFLVVASRLVYIKSRLILPSITPSEEEEIDITDQLKLYKYIVELSKKVLQRYEDGRQSFAHAEPVRKVQEFVLPTNSLADNLASSMRQIIARLKPPDPLPKVSILKSVSIKEKIQSIRAALDELRRLTFSRLVPFDSEPIDVVVSFLAILEMMKADMITIQQEKSFSDFTIERV